jgi:cell division septal protein FtsQ
MTGRAAKSATSRNRRVSTSVQDRRRLLLEVKTRQKTATRQKRRRIWQWVWLLLFWGTFVTVLAVSAQTVLEKFFFENPDYNLERIEVNRPDLLSAEEIEHLTGIAPGMNLFRLDLGTAQTRLSRIPELERVSIERVLPDTLRVSLVVREPVAWLADAADPPELQPYLLVEASGHFFRPHKILPSYYDLPLITGGRIADLEANDILHREDLREALALLQTIRFSNETTLSVRTVDISKGFCLEVRDRGDALVIFDIGSYPAQLARLQKLLDHCAETGRELEMVNLIPQRNTPVRFVMAALPASIQPANNNPQTSNIR